MSRFAIVLSAVGLLALAACSSGKPAPKAADPASTTASLRNAASARASDSEAASSNAVLGTAFTLGDLSITVSKPRLGGDGGGPWIVVDVQVRNASSNAADPVNFGIVCQGATDAGGTQAGGTMNTTAGYPAGSVDHGTLNLLTTGDSRTGAKVPACGSPAAVQIAPLASGPGFPGPVRVPLPSALIEQLNAARK